MSNLSTKQFLLELKAKDIQIRLDGDRLKINAPKDTISASLKEELATRKQEILGFLKTAAGKKKNRPSLIKTTLDTPAPLSFGQQRVWLLHELNKEQKVAYDTLTFNLRLQGQLNFDALYFSVMEVVKCHQALRMCVDFYQEQPVQKILDIENIVFETKDLTEKNDQDRDLLIESLLEEAKQTLFDLETGPLFKPVLIKLDENDHVFIIIIHHMVFDAWSADILLPALVSLYERFQQGDMSSLPAQTLHYTDFSRWQRQWMQGEELDENLNYWSDKLKDLPTLDLALDYPRPSVQTYNGASETLRLPKTLSEKLVKLGQNNDASLFMTMLSSLGLFFSRYTGQKDVSIGTPISNRDQAELQDVIGYFLNTLVMRLDFTDNGNFINLLSRCRQTCLDAFAHQHLPFEKLIEELNVERDQSRSPLFQILFVLNKAQQKNSLSIQDLELNFIQEMGRTTNFDIEVYISETPDGLDLSLIYNTDLFKAETIKQMLRHYQNLLNSIVMQPQHQISNLTLLDADEKHQILELRNQTQKDYHLETTIAELFEQQVDRTPENIAVSFEGQALSYLELEQRANQLAHYLQENQLGVGDYVSVFMDRSLEMIIALYGILKAGAAYVPLDPEYPAERLGWMLEDTQSRLIITQHGLVDKLPGHNAAVIDLDGADSKSLLQGYEQSRLSPVASSTDTAYVIYTSGSTGRPKGVMNAHDGVINFLLCMQDIYSLDTDDRVLLKTPYSFDVSVSELFWPLLNGSELVIARPGGHRDPDYLSVILQEKQITTLNFVPSMLRAFLDADEIKKATALKRVILIGEVVSYDLQSQFFQQTTSELHNMYGPTEAAVVVSHWQCRADGDSKIVPIGYPISNTRLYILDSHLQPVPDGVSGELHIGGIQVAQGYLHRDELTSEKFIPDPFDTQTGSRLYKTGDLVRYQTDGSIEYLGRMDNQIKLRGFRIELGEIEHALATDEKVTAALAIVRGDKTENPRLVAYVTGMTQSEFNEDLLKELLSRYVPQYMVPSNIIRMDKFPLLSNGKVDNKALPEPSRAVKRVLMSNNKPESEMEIILAEIWEELLVLDDIETNDMFYDLGGHSLLTLKVVEKFAKETGIRLSPLSLMNQTLRQLVAGLEMPAKDKGKPRAKNIISSIKNTLLKSR